MNKTIFSEEWLSLKQNNGYTYLHEEKCNGKLIAFLPYKINSKNNIEYLMRMEICPAHGDNHEFCGIIGGYDNLQYTIDEVAVKELEEETGYKIELDELQPLGWIWDSKIADTKVYLYTADLTNCLEGIATTDGTELEKNSYCKWTSLNECMKTKDSKVHTILNMLNYRDIY